MQTIVGCLPTLKHVTLNGHFMLNSVLRQFSFNLYASMLSLGDCGFRTHCVQTNKVTQMFSKDFAVRRISDTSVK